MAEGASVPENEAQSIKGRQVREALRGAAGSAIVEATRRKIDSYVDRIIAGESPQTLLTGLPVGWIQEIQGRVSTIRSNVADPENTWRRLQDPTRSVNAADRKVFDYACRILQGENPSEVTRALPETWKGGVNNYINGIKNLPPVEPKNP